MQNHFPPYNNTVKTILQLFIAKSSKILAIFEKISHSIFHYRIHGTTRTLSVAIIYYYMMKVLHYLCFSVFLLVH